MRWLATTSAVEVDRPVEAVWEFVTEVANLPRWVRGVSEPALTSGGPLGVGSTLRSQYRYAGRSHELAYVVTGCDAPGWLSIRSTAGPFPVELSLALTPVGSGVRVEKRTNAGSDGWATAASFVLLGPLLRWTMRRQMGKELAGLKGWLEG